MSTDDVSVTLAAGLAPYQRTLASSLLEAGMLRRLFDFSPWRDIYIQEPDGEGSLKRIKRFPAYRFSTRAAWWIWRHLPGPMRPRPPVAFGVSLADRLMANWISPSTIFHGCTASCLVCLRTARRLGAITLVESASRHPRQWKQIEADECRLLGMDSRDGSGDSAELLLRRRDREFDTCDRIVVPSTVACESFAEMGYADKTVIVLTGVDINFYAPKPDVPKGKPGAEKEPPPLFRACYVGRVEPAKGLGYLLQAWKRLALPRAQLQLVGAVKPQMESLLKNYAGTGVRIMGFLPPREVAKCYRESNLFVLPSPNEGLAQVLLEAMASGLPAVATDMTGANDCIENGKEGFIVPARDVDALADAILWCYHHPDESRTIGLNARARIEGQFTLDHYNQRQIALYRSLAKIQKPA